MSRLAIRCVTPASRCTAHEPGAEQGAALALRELLEDDEVYLAGLVLQRDEGDVVGRGRALAVDDEAGGADERAAKARGQHRREGSSCNHAFPSCVTGCWIASPDPRGRGRLL